MKREDSEWLYGPGVVAWLDKQGLRTLAERKSDRARMALRRWNSGSAANYFALDAFLTELSIVASPNLCAPNLLDELPDELFCTQPDYHPKEVGE